MDSRIEKSKRNLSYGMLYQIMYLILNFVVRISIINCLGVISLSLNGLFTEVLSILSLAEMGVGTAITYSLYKPLAEDDHKKVSQLMSYFKTAYHVITIVMFVGGLIMIPFLKYIIKDVDVAWWYQVLVYILFLINTCASYWFSHRMLLITADQKAYVCAKTNLVVRGVFFGISLCMIWFAKNFILYLISEIGYSFVYYFVLAKQADKMYPYLDDKDKLPKEERKQLFVSVKQAFAGKLANRVLNSTDNILISSLVGTALVGIYSTYSMFTNGFQRVFAQVNEAIVGSVGNVIATESPEHIKETYDRSTYLFFVMGSVCSVCMYAAIQPFLTMIIGKNLLLSEAVLLIVIINLFEETLKMPLWTYFEAAGRFKEGQWISIVGCVLNIIVSIIWGKMWGMFGIFLGTFVSLALMIACKIVVLGKHVFNGRQGFIIKDFIKYNVVFAAEMVLAKLLSPLSTGIMFIDFLLKGIAGLVITIMLSVVVFRETDEFQYVFEIARKKLKC